MKRDWVDKTTSDMLKDRQGFAMRNGNDNGNNPRKLTQRVKETILSFIRQGSTIKDACLAAGITPATYCNWSNRAKEIKAGPVFEFFEAIKKAEAEGSTERIGRIGEAAKGGALIERTTRISKDGSEQITERYSAPQWQADAWLQERKYPQEWGRRERIAIQIELKREVERIAEEYHLNPDEVLREAELMLKAAK